MPDAIFSHPRLAGVYDPLDTDRSDLDAYDDLASDLHAVHVLDVGCGTGTLARRLVARDVHVLGVDPAAASIEVARAKVDSDRVRWVVGTAPDVADDVAHRAAFDLATMTANVAQVFVDDRDWLATLRAIRTCLRDGASLVLETRVPGARAWEGWTEQLTRKVVTVDGEGPVETWTQLSSVDGEVVTFETATIFHGDGERIDSTSTLRFRTEDSLRRSLGETGFTDVDVRDLPYAPGRGWLVVARAATPS